MLMVILGLLTKVKYIRMFALFMVTIVNCCLQKGFGILFVVSIENYKKSNKMFLESNHQKIRVFVADATGDIIGKRNSLRKVLSRAGLDVVAFDEKLTEEAVREAIASCDCSVHVLGAISICESSDGGTLSQPALQYRIARERQDGNFRMFLWNPLGYVGNNNAYVTNIRREIVENTIYSSTTSQIVFAEDLRVIMSVTPNSRKKLSDADIFFIYNDLDSETASDILAMMQDVQKVTSLSINMSSDTDYSAYILSQFEVCKICVVYFDYAADWAMSFSRQIWKDNGGNSSKVPLFLAANSEHAQASKISSMKNFMEYSVTEKDLIPLDIKIFFDKVTGNA
jgi:hypothetical protein